MTERRQICENCGTEITQTTNFCPNCGAAQRPDPEVPTDPPPQRPEADRISTPTLSDVPSPPRPRSNRNLYFAIGGCGVLLVLLLLGFIARAAIISGGVNASVPSETTDDGTGSQEEITAEDTTQGSSSTKRSKPKRDKPSSTAGKSADPYLQFTDGTHQVGKDIQAGTYRTRDSSSGCYFARLNGFSGELDDILANENTDNPAIVTIEPTDEESNLTDAGHGHRICLP